jgi:hypothetical protein
MAPTKKDLPYPFLLECLQFAPDLFWETVFEDLAHGRAPTPSYISKGFLCCGQKGKEFSFKLERRDPKTNFDQIYTLLTEKIGLASQKERLKKEMSFQEAEKALRQSQQDWGSVRKKTVRDSLYEKYVLQCKDRYNLTISQCKYLLAVITISLMFKTITSKDITYNEDGIENINGIDFIPCSDENKENRCYDIVLERPLCKTRKIIEDDSDVEPSMEIVQESLKDYWKKYIETLSVKMQV